jgi:hypothetical protein
MRALLISLTILSILVLGYIFFKAKWFDNFIKKTFDTEKNADDLLNQIIDADTQAEKKQTEIKKDAVKMKKKLDSLDKVRKTVSVAKTTKNKKTKTTHNTDEL